jgi:hypothetical protein
MTINWNNQKPYMASTRSVKSNELYFIVLIQWLNILMQHNDVIHLMTFKILLYT